MDTITYKNRQLTLMQNPHIEQFANKLICYTAMAQDNEGNEYRIIWDLYPEALAAELSFDPALMWDPEDCCDWSKPSEIIEY